MTDDTKWLDGYSDEVLAMIREHLLQSDYSDQPGWVQWWVDCRIRAIDRQLRLSEYEHANPQLDFV